MSIKLDSNGGITFPSWTTDTRPATPNIGQTGFNSSLNALEYYNGYTWLVLESVNTSIQYSWSGMHSFTNDVNIDRLILKELAETINVSATAATGTINFDTYNQTSMFLTTNATANWTPNFRANSTVSLNAGLSNGQSVSVAMLVTQGATAYVSSAVNINGTATGVTTRWLGGVAPTAGSVNGINLYTYNIIKTGTNTFTVLASQSLYR